MFGLILRIVIGLAVLAGLALLFFYAFIAAIIVVPILIIALMLFGRRAPVQWWVVRPGERGPARRPGQVIDHDPNDLPPSDHTP